MTEPERWLPVVDWEGLYEVSDLGRVRSLPRIIQHGTNAVRRRQGRMLAPQVVAGHARVPYRSLFLFRGDGKRRRFPVHILVARAFLGMPAAGHEVCHGPGGSLDNRLANLSYGTHSKNGGEDRRRDGTLPQGERSRHAKLSDEIVLECRARAAAGQTSIALAREFNVSPSTISNAVSGRTWSHLQLRADPAAA